MTGGVEVVCNSLVQSSRQFISVGPSMISTIMQSMTSSAVAAAEEKAKAADSDNVEGLFNFAPLGKLYMDVFFSSTSPSSHIFILNTVFFLLLFVLLLFYFAFSDTVVILQKGCTV